MSDQAPDKASGYIYQFELALLVLSTGLKKDEFLSIEKIDDLVVSIISLFCISKTLRLFE